jgi:hypothetical protein
MSAEAGNIRKTYNAMANWDKKASVKHIKLNIE